MGKKAVKEDSLKIRLMCKIYEQIRPLCDTDCQAMIIAESRAEQIVIDLTVPTPEDYAAAEAMEPQIMERVMEEVDKVETTGPREPETPQENTPGPDDANVDDGIKDELPNPGPEDTSLNEGVKLTHAENEQPAVDPNTANDIMNGMFMSGFGGRHARAAMEAMWTAGDRLEVTVKGTPSAIRRLLSPF